MFSQKSFRIKQDDKFFSKLLSRDSFRSSRVFYYGETPGAVPFVWESQPGTPIHGKSMLADLDEDTVYLPPLTPPPSYYSGSLSGMTPTVVHKKKSRPKFVLCAIFSKLTTKKAHMTPSPSRSSASSSQSSSSSSSNWSRSYSPPSASIRDYSRSRFCVHDFDAAPTAMDYYMARNMMMPRQRESFCILSRCTSITTGEDGPIPRCKPFKYTYEKEIVMYAYFKRLDYFSTECIYSPNAYRGFAREFIKDLERIRPRAILDIIRSGENFRISTSTRMPEQGTCERCGYISSQKWCKACVLLEGLNKGLPKLGIGRTRGSNVEQKQDQARNGSSIASKQCGTLDF